MNNFKIKIWSCFLFHQCLYSCIYILCTHPKTRDGQLFLRKLQRAHLTYVRFTLMNFWRYFKLPETSVILTHNLGCLFQSLREAGTTVQYTVPFYRALTENCQFALVISAGTPVFYQICLCMNSQQRWCSPVSQLHTIIHFFLNKIKKLP